MFLTHLGLIRRTRCCLCADAAVCKSATEALNRVCLGLRLCFNGGCVWLRLALPRIAQAQCAG